MGAASEADASLRGRSLRELAMASVSPVETQVAAR
jgi:hypothetical protein